jgi:protoporphyrinogen oxidase
MKKILIVGSGFNGFCNAYQLIKKNKYEVTIIDNSPFFGGIMYSRKIYDFYVDNGVHVFDGIPRDLSKIVKKIIKNKVDDVDFISQSAFNQKVTKGFSLPDLSSISALDKKKIKKELLLLEKKYSKKKNQLKFKNLYDFFSKRFGSNASRIFSLIFKKIYNIDPKKIEPQAISQTSMARLKFLNDTEMLKLKKFKFLDTVLAARRKKLGKIDDLESIYPNEGMGMRGWCESAKKFLERKKVKIHLNQKINKVTQLKNKILIKTNEFEKEFDKILWCNDNLGAISNLVNKKIKKNFQHPISVIFYVLVTKRKNIKNFTYLQNFDLNSLSYRIAAGGVYGNQLDSEGNTFITVECPTKINSKIWKKPDQSVKKIWKECKKLKLIKDKSILKKYHVTKIPITLKMPLLGFSSYREKIVKLVNQKYKDLVFDVSNSFFRREIYLNSLKVVERLKK